MQVIVTLKIRLVKRTSLMFTLQILGKIRLKKLKKCSRVEVYLILMSLILVTQMLFQMAVTFSDGNLQILRLIVIIQGLNTANSVGSGGIPLRFIKDSLYFIALYLTCIINTSIDTGVFPTSWKQALVVPLFKSDDSNDMKNYRPISLLPIVSKILQKIVAWQLMQFLEFNNLLSHTQHGFRPRLSTETALTVITDKIFNNMDSKKISVLTLCDVSKAFDSVSHEKLLHKCAELNVDSFWLSSYTKIELNLSALINGCSLIQYADDTQFL